MKLRRIPRAAALAGLAAILFAAITSFAQQPHGQNPRPIVTLPGAGPRPGTPAHPSAGAHADPSLEGSRTGEHGGHERAPFNFATGFLGEKDGVEPSLLYRKPGTPVPFLANLINFAIFFGLLVRFAKKPVADGLVKRKETLMHDIAEAAKVKEAAEKRLAEYEAKLAKIDSECERIKRDYKLQAERDRERIVREAKEKRERMKRDAAKLVESESNAAERALIERTIAAATAAAEAKVKQALTSQDQERLAIEFLSDLQRAMARETRSAS